VKTLVFWGAPEAGPARARQAAGASLLAWNEAAADALAAAGVEHQSARQLLALADHDAADEAAILWTRRFGKRPLLDGRSLRELHEWKGVSLWWFAELYLHHSTGSPRRVRLIEAFDRLLEQLAPDEAEAVGLPREEALLLARTCTARGVLFHDPPSPPRAARASWQRLRCRLYEAKTLLTVLKARLAGGKVEPPRGGKLPVLFLSHAAFWRERETAGGRSEGYEHYFDRLIPETERHAALQPVVVAVGPQSAFRRRGAGARVREWLSLSAGGSRYSHINRFVRWRTFLAVREVSARMRKAWRELRASPALQEAFSHKGVAFADLAGEDLAGSLLLQIPWAVRCYEEMSEALAATRPSVVCLYAESSGWGRAAVAACRAHGVKTLGIQHGILYPSYYSYRHDEDEADCPRPDRTAVFGEAARRFLVLAGRYPAASLVVTGSPKFDELLEASRTWDRAAIRDRLGVSKGERLVAVASRFRGIRETHQSIGSAFPALVRATAALPRVKLLVKPHPAEGTDGYERTLRELRAERVSLLPPQADLMQLLFAADALVTVESLSAVEALVLGRPVLILNMPTNLREMVENGVALGVPAGADPKGALQSVLEDEDLRQSLAEARSEYLGDVASGVDGHATERLLALLLETARGRAGQGPIERA
jgi:hypothetical protein